MFLSPVRLAGDESKEVKKAAPSAPPRRPFFSFLPQNRTVVLRVTWPYFLPPTGRRPRPQPTPLPCALFTSPRTCGRVGVVKTHGRRGLWTQTRVQHGAWPQGQRLGVITKPTKSRQTSEPSRTRAHHRAVGPRSPSCSARAKSREIAPTPSGPTHLCTMSPSTGSSAAPACCRRIRSLILFLTVDLVHPALIGSCGSRASLSAVVPRRCTSASSVRSTPRAG